MAADVDDRRRETTGEEDGVTALEAHVRRQLAVQRKNLMGVCRMCVKSLVDKAAFESITDSCPHLQNFCIVMETILMHRVQVRWSFFGGSEPIHFWSIITRLTPSVSISSVLDMENILTDLGRGRVWLRIALVQKKLSHFMSSLLPRTDTLKTMYLPGAFMRSEELTELSGTLKCLDAIDFNLCIKGQNFDIGERYEICYHPYLTFKQSKRSNIDDCIEEEKLKSPISDNPLGTWSHPLSPRLFSPRSSVMGSGEEEEERCEVGEDVVGGRIRRKKTSPGDSPTHLREILKVEREQKNYFEELVCVRDSQLGRLRAELQSVGETADKDKQLMESVVLELQQQIECLQLKLRSQRVWQGTPAIDDQEECEEEIYSSSPQNTPDPITELPHPLVLHVAPLPSASQPVNQPNSSNLPEVTQVRGSPSNDDTSGPGKMSSFLTTLLDGD